jgi:hypothetical protein
LRYKTIGAPEKFKKWPHTLFRPRTNHTCHPKQNPSRETVPSRSSRFDDLLKSIFLNTIRTLSYVGIKYKVNSKKVRLQEIVSNYELRQGLLNK